MNRIVSGQHDSYVLGEEPLFKGGGGQLFAVHDRPDLLYKRFNEPLNGGHRKRVAELVEVGRQLARRSDLRWARRIAWPVDLALEGASVVGVAVPRAPDAYFKLLAPIPVAQSFGHLAGPAHAPPAAVRLIVVRQLACALQVLAKEGLVHGDISNTNILWTHEPEPALLLIDCDGIHRRGFQTDRAGTLHWLDPLLEQDLIERHDAQSDWYALALAVYRAIVLNARAVPLERDFGWIERELPSPIAERLLQVFSHPLDAKARVPPKEWETALRGVIEKEAECRRVDALAGKRPSTVADRRAAGRGEYRRRAHAGRARRGSSPAPVPSRVPAPSRAPAPSLTPPPMPKARRRHAAAAQGARRGPRLVSAAACLLLAIFLPAIGIFASYRITGLPNWPILNTLNPFLSSSQRDLVASLPGDVRHCLAYESRLPAHAIAAVRCEWDGRDVIAIDFASGRAMDSYYARRAARARRAMPAVPPRSACPRRGRWHGRDGRPLGRLTVFATAKEARLDWSRASARTYFLSVSSDPRLRRLCDWWKRLSGK